MPVSTSTQEDEALARGRALLLAQTECLDALIHDLHLLDGGMDKPAIRVPLLMLQAVGVSLHSILALTRERDMAIRDCFGIARSAVETAVNAAYIAVGGEPVADQAIKHMRQKRWRDRRREANFAGWRIEARVGNPVAPEAVPGLREAVDEYTNKRGGEVRDWTPANIEQRINLVAERSHGAGLCFGAAVFAIYRPSSELLHGTFYGVEYFWLGSRDTPVETKEAFEHVWLFDHFVTLLTAGFFAVSGAVNAMADVFQIRGHMERQEPLAQHLTKLVDDINALASPR